MSWLSARKRCFDPKGDKFKFYGGRGITICEEWRDDYAAFLRDMGERPPGTTLDRIDTNGNYEPGNCRWATMEVQIKNRRLARTVRLIDFDGQQMPAAHFAKRIGVPAGTVWRWLSQGATPDQIVVKALRQASRASEGAP
jgi:ribosomal protein S16